jgi:hypothetical protein
MVQRKHEKEMSTDSKEPMTANEFLIDKSFMGEDQFFHVRRHDAKTYGDKRVEEYRSALLAEGVPPREELHEVAKSSTVGDHEYVAWKDGAEYMRDRLAPAIGELRKENDELREELGKERELLKYWKGVAEEWKQASISKAEQLAAKDREIGELKTDLMDKTVLVRKLSELITGNPNASFEEIGHEIGKLKRPAAPLSWPDEERREKAVLQYMPTAETFEMKACRGAFRKGWEAHASAVQPVVNEIIRQLEDLKDYSICHHDQQGVAPLAHSLAVDIPHRIDLMLTALRSGVVPEGDAVEFLDSIRDYERESGNAICYDERSSEELYEQFKNRK